MTGNDTDGTPVAITTIRLLDTGDERVADAERTISDLAAAAEGPLRVSSVSPAVVEDEYKEATESAMVPIIVISLTVDYAIQAVSHYREQRAEGLPVLQAVRTGLRNVAVPLALAAVTTIASFLATLFSPISTVADFGVVAGLGVGLSLIALLMRVLTNSTAVPPLELAYDSVCHTVRASDQKSPSWCCRTFR